MKNVSKVVVVFLLAFISLSCEEDFNPASTFKEYYVLNCLINYDESKTPTSITTRAFLGKSYKTDGFVSPGVHDTNLIKTDIYLSINGQKTPFRCFRNRGTDTTWLNYYYANPAIFSQNVVKLYANLPNGKVLTSETVIPSGKSFSVNYDWPHGVTPKISQFKWGNGVIISWLNDNENNLLFPKCTILYQKISTMEYKEIEVPLKVVKKDGQLTPLYPMPTKDSCADFEFTAIDYVLKKIAETEGDPSDCRVGKINFVLRECDANLSDYFSSNKGFMDMYSVRLDENIFSSVNGGLGVFGTVRTHRMKINLYLAKDWVTSYGLKFMEF